MSHARIFLRFFYRSRTLTLTITLKPSCVISKLLCNLTIFRMHVLNVLSRQKWSLLCSRSIYIVKWLGLLSQRNQSKLRMYTVELTFKLNTQKLTAMVAVSKSPLSSAKWFYLHFISVFFRL